MNSASDHGYNVDWSIRVTPGLIFTEVSAEGRNQMKVLRRHREPGCWECVWLEGPRERGIYIMTGAEILDAAYGRKTECPVRLLRIQGRGE